MFVKQPLASLGSAKHKMTHSGEYGYKCSHCEKSFSRSGILKSHKGSHTGKPFFCPCCETSSVFGSCRGECDRDHGDDGCCNGGCMIKSSLIN